MAKPFKTLKNKMAPEGRRRADDLKKALLTEASIRELRQIMDLTQANLAAEMHITQAAVSNIENESDILISTLRRTLEAMGGALKIVAVLPNKQEIVITQFRDISAS
jgi:DNA-binding XRE family transcriptional regulator